MSNTTASTNGQHIEKDYGDRQYNLGGSEDPENALRKIRTAGSISISPELFEKIYLSPQNAVKGELRKTFANPTPLALVGFLLALSPLSAALMGWRGAGGNGSADIGAFFFMGGLLMILGSVGEFLLGNTFPFVVFGSFGGFWLTFGATLQNSFFGAAAAYAAETPKDPSGFTAPSFNATFGFFLVFMGVLCFIYMICSLRTNIVFFVIFLSLVLAFSLLAGAFWQGAKGNASLSGKLQIGGGACTFVTSMAGWYIFFVILLASVDFPLQLPLGDLSTMIKGASEKVKTEHPHSA